MSKRRRKRKNRFKVISIREEILFRSKFRTILWQLLKWKIKLILIEILKRIFLRKKRELKLICLLELIPLLKKPLRKNLKLQLLQATKMQR